MKGRKLALPPRNTCRDRFPSRQARIRVRRPGERTVVCYPAGPVQIGEILIERGHLTPEGLEEALDWQVLYGGGVGPHPLRPPLGRGGAPPPPPATAAGGEGGGGEPPVGPPPA